MLRTALVQSLRVAQQHEIRPRLPVHDPEPVVLQMSLEEGTSVELGFGEQQRSRHANESNAAVSGSPDVL